MTIDDTLLRPAEQPDVDGLAEDVSVHRLEDFRARLPGVGAWLDVDLRVERVDLDRVVMKRSIRGVEEATWA